MAALQNQHLKIVSTLYKHEEVAFSALTWSFLSH